MTITANALLNELQARRLAGADTAEPAVDPDASTPGQPWYIAWLLGTSGWVAGCFALGFIALLFRGASTAAFGAAGGVLLAAAWGLLKFERGSALVSQLAIALSVAGQCLVLYATSAASHGIGPFAARAFLLQTALALAMPNALHRAMSTFFAMIAWALTVRFLFFGESASWSTPQGHGPRLQVAWWGWWLTWLPVGVAGGTLIRLESSWMARGWQASIRPILNGLLLGLAFATLASQPFDSFLWLLDPSHAVSGLALWPLFSVIAAIGAASLAFAIRSGPLIGAAVIAALLHLTAFYYVLGTSLLVKSVSMLSLGAVMWAVAWALSRKETP